MSRRLEIGIAALASATLSGALLWPALLEFGSRLPGGWASWGQGWGMARLRWTLSGQSLPAVDGPVVLAGWPQLLSGAGLWELGGPAAAVTLSVWLWLAAGLWVSWCAARSLGASRLGASLGALAAGLNPVIWRATREGWLEWLAVPLIALAFWGALAPGEGKKGALIGIIGGLAAGATAACTPALGAATALMVSLAALGRGGDRFMLVTTPALAGALLGGWPYRGIVPMPRPNLDALLAYLDPADLLAPFWVWRDWGLHLGLGLALALAAGAWLWRRGEARRATLLALAGAAALGLLLALGPELRWGATPLVVGGQALPLPAAFFQRFIGAGMLIHWRIALVPVGVALGLLLSQLRAPRLAGGALALLAAELLLAPRLPTVDGRVPVAITQLAEGSGPLLQLPLELGAVEGDEGRAFKALYWQGVHRRPLVTGMASLWESPLFHEPLVILAVNAQLQEERWAVPPAGPASVLRELGVAGIIVDRSGSTVGALALLDRLLYKAMESPQRDLAGRIDLYTVPEGRGWRTQVEPMELTELRKAPKDWLSSADYLSAWQ
ncbi:MAG: hypothetical protein H6741_13730 [Alphaproteobacteria bacterium]|nr:hypothetical protein [Alphaproteobacteria bacterium]